MTIDCKGSQYMVPSVQMSVGAHRQHSQIRKKPAL
jgi:hypothetical protein